MAAFSAAIVPGTAIPMDKAANPRQNILRIDPLILWPPILQIFIFFPLYIIILLYCFVNFLIYHKAGRTL